MIVVACFFPLQQQQQQKRRLKSEITYYYCCVARLNGLIGMRIDFIGNFDFEIRISWELA